MGSKKSRGREASARLRKRLGQIRVCVGRLSRAFAHERDNSATMWGSPPQRLRTHTFRGSQQLLIVRRWPQAL
jgi:hypothetical protein